MRKLGIHKQIKDLENRAEDESISDMFDELREAAVE